MLLDEVLAAVPQEAARAGETRTLDEVHRAVRSGPWEPLVHSDSGRSLFRGAPGSLRVSEYKEWAEQALAEQSPQSREDVLEAMLALAFNAFSSQPSKRYQVIYRTLSKVNHSCVPNACVLAPDEGPAQLVCLRAVRPGDEVTVSYLTDVELGFPAEARSALLTDSWEFACRCPRCQAPSDDTRGFSCPSSGCGGRCPMRRESTGPGPASTCDACGAVPAQSVIEEWAALEAKVCSLIAELPEGLYSAWAFCEEFSEKHPLHWLAGRWKQHLAGHTAWEASQADDLEEAATLRAEAETHLEACHRCLDAAIRTASQAAAPSAVLAMAA